MKKPGSDFNPRALLREAGITRDSIIRAANVKAGRSEYHDSGLCSLLDPPRRSVAHVLRQLGGRPQDEYFWPPEFMYREYRDGTRDRAKEQRLMMLAFMLTWLEDDES